MRKFIICLICVWITVYTYLPNDDIFKGISGDRTIYSESKSSNAVITVVTNQNSSTIRKVKNITGQSITLKNDTQSAKKIIDKYNYHEVFSETANDFCSKYYYSDKIKTYVYIGGRKVNLQINENKNFVTIGYPIIFGGF